MSLPNDKCEFIGCDSKSDVWIAETQALCWKHYVQAKYDISELRKSGRRESMNIGGLKVYIIESMLKEVSVKQVQEKFKVSYPTAKNYLERLSQTGIIENGGNGKWVLKK